MASWSWYVALLTISIAYVILSTYFADRLSTTMQEKTLFLDKLAEMPSCNLVETVHNKWLQAFSNNSGDLYVAAVDDYIRIFLQVVAYYQYLKGGVDGFGPRKKELRLRSA